MSHCSFDDKSGIWKNEKTISKEKNSVFKDLKTLSTDEEMFSKIVQINPNFNLKISKKILSTEWNDIFYNQTNNFDNFEYTDLNNLIFKSRKISRFNINKRFLYTDNFIITADEKGNLIIFSSSTNDLFKYNFYKKKFKSFKKKLNIISDEKNIYVSDNLGYLYAFNINQKKNTMG